MIGSFGGPFLIPEEIRRIVEGSCSFPPCFSQASKDFVLTHALLERNSIPGFVSLQVFFPWSVSSSERRTDPHSLWVVIATSPDGPFPTWQPGFDARDLICQNVFGHFVEENISFLRVEVAYDRVVDDYAWWCRLFWCSSGIWLPQGVTASW